VVSAERQRLAIEMRRAGKTYAAIGEALGVTDGRAAQLVSAALEETRKEIAEGAEKLRAMEVERIEEIAAGIYDAAKAGDLRAIDRWVKLRERYARLLGLDLQPGGDDGRAGVVIVTGLPAEVLRGGEVVDGEAVELPAIGQGDD
jgi:hypothetical protein